MSTFQQFIKPQATASHGITTAPITHFTTGYTPSKSHQIHSGGVTLVVPNTPKTTTLTNIPGTNIKVTSGWWVFVGVFGAIMLSGTPVVGPAAFGIMSIALIYQLNALLKEHG